jgi:hypothetical protein
MIFARSKFHPDIRALSAPLAEYRLNEKRCH